MNRISLYEAIRRKKESQGLNTTTPKPAQVSDPNKRAEPRAPLKQPLAHEKPVIQAKQAVKSPIIRPLSHKSSLLKKPHKDFWQRFSWISSYIKKNPMTIWVAAGGLVVILVLLGVFNMLSNRQTDTDQPVDPTETVKTVSPVSEKKVEKKAPEQQVVVTKPQEKAVPTQQPAAVPPVKQVEIPKPEPKAQIPAAIQSQLPKQAEAVQPQAPKAESKGDHIIVIAAYTRQEDLTPVSAYFRQNAIETEVTRQGSYFLLVTKDRFENPERTGTDGFKMKQTIKRIGANYKAPSGYERFSSTPFQDAYGKKVK